MNTESPRPSYRIKFQGQDGNSAVIEAANPLSCAYLGPEGTNGEQAAREILGNQVNYKPEKTNALVVDSVFRRRTDLGIVPVENSIQGNIVESVRALIYSEQHDDATLRILAEKVIRIEHCLFGDQSTLKDKVVMSHPEALNQCDNWLKANLSDYDRVSATSTAEAVRLAGQNHHLAIGNRLAGEFHGVPVISEDIADLKTNFTRFWLLGYGSTEPTGHDRTTLIFTLANETGSLAGVLNKFSENNIGICKIDSQPIGTLDEYIFLLSVTGHILDPKMKDVIERIKKDTWKVKVLGSYKKDLTDIVYDPLAIQFGWVVKAD